jgi:hypothetical protein
MTYASIEEAWPSDALTIPLEKRQHPLHQKQMGNNQGNNQRNIQGNNQRNIQGNNQQFYPEPKDTSGNELYQCSYGTHDCNQIFEQNKSYNNEKKAIAAGIQNFLPSSPKPQNYNFLPQYPWHPWAQQGYLMYGPQASQMWYNDPFRYNPEVANQILHKQLYSNVGPMTPAGPYEPRGFIPGSPKIIPPVDNPSYLDSNKEYFQSDISNSARMYPARMHPDVYSQINAVRAEMNRFIFFLVTLIIILIAAMVYIVCVSKKVVN